MTVRLSLFGAPTIEHDGESVALPFERRNQLLVFLALKRSWVGRAELATMLWPELGNKLAFSNLRKTLFRLQAQPWGKHIELQAGAVRFEAESDVCAFETALRDHRIADALSLWRGDLLAGFDGDRSEAWAGWLGFERERLRTAWRSAALDHLAGEIEAARGIELSARLLDADPLDEAALRAHMRWLARGGQTGAAREAYRRFVARLEAELGLAPGPELKSLHDGLGSAVTAPLPPSQADDGFVGRSVELRRIATLLAQPDCRLLCLVGPGGVGKTRLAQRAMHDHTAAYPDGAVFIALEDVAAPAEIGARLAREIGVATGTGEPWDPVIEFLRQRRMLLVLDNFEHLASAAGQLDRLLQSCAQLKLIVTSRVRLATAGEWLLPIDGLPCPEMEDQDRIEAFDAARLFVKAAQHVEPALIPAAEAAAIVDICRQVEGLPLALELAAAWTRVLSCEAIASELREGTDLLLAVDAARPARHASFDVVFEQSWRLLSPVEREALARLSVFRGGFSAEAARAVATASLPVLGALADKSLLRKDGERLSMHPLVQQLAALRLRDSAARDSAQAAHAAYFHRLLAQLRTAIEFGDREALRRVDVEFENCRVAWRWAIEHGAGTALAQCAQAVLNFCDHRGRPEEGHALLCAAVELQSVHADPGLQAQLLVVLAIFEYRLDRYAAAETLAARALAAARVARIHDVKLQCMNVLGSCGLRLGRLDEARRYFKQALREAPANSNPHNVAVMLDHLALIEKMSGRYDEALRLSMDSLIQHRRLRDAAGEALCLSNLGALCLARQDYESAGQHLRAGLAICDHHGIVSTRLLVLANLTEVAAKTGDDAAAQASGTRALELARAGGNRALECWLKLQFMRLALRQGALAAARAEVCASMEIAVAIARPSLQIAGVGCFAELLHAQGESACARLVMQFAADHPSTSAPERDEFRSQLTQWPPDPGAESEWTGLELGDLIHRIVVERDLAHAPLIATLRGGRD